MPGDVPPTPPTSASSMPLSVATASRSVVAIKLSRLTKVSVTKLSRLTKALMRVTSQESTKMIKTSIYGSDGAGITWQINEPV